MGSSAKITTSCSRHSSQLSQPFGRDTSKLDELPVLPIHSDAALLAPTFQIEVAVFRSDEQSAFRGAEEVGGRRAAGVAGEWASVDRASVDENDFAVFLIHIFEQVGIHAVDQKVEISIIVPVDGVQFYSTAATGSFAVQTKRLA